MKCLILVLCLAVFASARPSLLLGGTLIGPGNAGVILDGPSAKATVAGPDGSLIGAAGQAGVVVAPAQPGGVVSAAVSPGLVGLGVGVPCCGGIGPIGLGIGLKGW